MSTNGASAPAAMRDHSNTVLSGSTVNSVVNIGVLPNKIALITGASSGLGRAIAQAYAAAGAYIVSGDITPNPPVTPILAETMKARGDNLDMITPTVDLLNKNFPSADGIPRAIHVHCDVTQPESMEAAVRAAVAQYGRLDIMVNNAGIAAEAGAANSSGAPLRIHETPVNFLEKTLAINVRGVWLGIKYATAQMLTQQPHPSGDRGWIINLSSIYGLVGQPGTTCYSASKGAVTNLTKSSALEYAADRIHINSIHPGYAETAMLEEMKGPLGNETATKYIADMHPWGRLAWPEDIAKMAVFLAGEGASFCTGSQFVVDGGYTAR